MKLGFIQSIIFLISLSATQFLSTQVYAQQDDYQQDLKNVSANFSLRVDGGALWQQRNDVAIPGDEGTRFDFADLEGGYFPFYRIEGNFDFAEKHRVRFLYAPLTLRLEGEFEDDVQYSGKTFRGGKKTKGIYRFNSYRMSWAYKIAQGPKTTWHLGFTGKVRDAETALEQDDVDSNYTNVGFVPLLHAAFQYRLCDRLRLYLDLDAAAAPQGRAEDLGLTVMYRFFPDWESGGGLRILEGGADNEKVYTFAWLNYAYLSIAYIR